VFLHEYIRPTFLIRTRAALGVHFPATLGVKKKIPVNHHLSVRPPMTEAEFKKHLDAAEKSPKQIAAAVSGLTDKVLRYKPSPEKWCVLEVLGHLADAEIIYGYRLRQMLADTKPVIAPLDQDAWACNLNYLDSPPAELVAFYGLARLHNLRLL